MASATATAVESTAPTGRPFPPTPVLTVLRDAADRLDAPARRLVGALEADYPRSLERRTGQLLRAAGCSVQDLDELLGTAGFTDLDELRRHASREAGLRITTRELRVRNDVDAAPATPVGRTGIETTLHREQQNLIETMRSMQASGALELAARCILGSRRRYVFGDLKSRGYAHLFASDLASALGQVELVDPTAASLLAAVGDAHGRDSLTVFCFRRYSRSTVRLAAQFADIGASVVAVTDHPDSPVCRYATHVLPVVTRSDSATHSPTAVTALGHTLAALATGGAKGADRRARTKSALVSVLDLYEEETVRS